MTAAIEPTRRSRVLVVDDDAGNLALLRALLEAEGFDAEAAVDGPGALARLGRGGIDLVLLDVRMPGMDGFEVCRRIREDPAKARLPVVFLTAEHTDLDDEVRGLEAGADDYVHKPVHRKALGARVRNLIRLADAEREATLFGRAAQAEKLAAIGQIAAGVAHEINNPLAFVLSNLGCLRNYLADLRATLAAYRGSVEQGRATEERLNLAETLADVDPLIEETIQGGERVRAIVGELKTFSRAEDPVLEPVDLAAVAASALLLTGRELSLRARIVRELAPAVLPRAPRAKLHQLMLNLLVNANQAIPAGAPAEHEIRVVTRTEGEEAILAVSDTGCGIPEEVQRRVFEPFFTTKPVGVGTGLGLSVVAATVASLGGHVELESVPGRGSTFVLRFPRAT